MSSASIVLFQASVSHVPQWSLIMQWNVKELEEQQRRASTFDPCHKCTWTHIRLINWFLWQNISLKKTMGLSTVDLDFNSFAVNSRSISFGTALSSFLSSCDVSFILDWSNLRSANVLAGGASEELIQVPDGLKDGKWVKPKTPWRLFALPTMQWRVATHFHPKWYLSSHLDKNGNSSVSLALADNIVLWVLFKLLSPLSNLPHLHSWLFNNSDVPPCLLMNGNNHCKHSTVTISQAYKIILSGFFVEQLQWNLEGIVFKVVVVYLVCHKRVHE